MLRTKLRLLTNVRFLTSNWGDSRIQTGQICNHAFRVKVLLAKMCLRHQRLSLHNSTYLIFTKPNSMIWTRQNLQLSTAGTMAVDLTAPAISSNRVPDLFPSTRGSFVNGCALMFFNRIFISIVCSFQACRTVSTEEQNYDVSSQRSDCTYRTSPSHTNRCSFLLLDGRVETGFASTYGNSKDLDFIFCGTLEQRNLEVINLPATLQLCIICLIHFQSS